MDPSLTYDMRSKAGLWGLILVAYAGGAFWAISNAHSIATGNGVAESDFPTWFNGLAEALGFLGLGLVEVTIFLISETRNAERNPALALAGVGKVDSKLMLSFTNRGSEVAKKCEPRLTIWEAGNQDTCQLGTLRWDSVPLEPGKRISIACEYPESTTIGEAWDSLKGPTFKVAGPGIGPDEWAFVLAEGSYCGTISVFSSSTRALHHRLKLDVRGTGVTMLVSWKPTSTGEIWKGTLVPGGRNVLQWVVPLHPYEKPKTDFK